MSTFMHDYRRPNNLKNAALAAVIVFGGKYFADTYIWNEPETPQVDRMTEVLSNKAVQRSLSFLDEQNPAAGACLRASMASFAGDNPNVNTGTVLSWSVADCLTRAESFTPR